MEKVVAVGSESELVDLFMNHGWFIHSFLPLHGVPSGQMFGGLLQVWLRNCVQGLFVTSVFGPASF